jgi:hypothetical protein
MEKIILGAENEGDSWCLGLRGGGRAFRMFLSRLWRGVASVTGRYLLCGSRGMLKNPVRL